MSKSRIDFVTSLSLETCLARLPREYIHPTSRGDYDFDTPTERPPGVYSEFQIRMNLARHGMETHIVGGVYITRYIYGFFLVFGIVALIAVQIEGIPFICFPIVVAFLALSLGLIRIQRFWHEKIIFDAFRPFKQKPKDFAWWQRWLFPGLRLKREASLSIETCVNTLLRLNYGTGSVQIRERKELFFTANYNLARVYGRMRVVQPQQTIAQYWIGINPVAYITPLLHVGLGYLTFAGLGIIIGEDRTLLIAYFVLAMVMTVGATMVNCFQLQRKLRKIFTVDEIRTKRKI